MSDSVLYCTGTVAVEGSTVMAHGDCTIIVIRKKELFFFVLHCTLCSGEREAQAGHTCVECLSL